MEHVGQFIVIVIVIGVVIAAIRYPHAQAKRRRREMQALAAKFGWTFKPEPISPHDPGYSYFDFFFSEHSRAAYNTLTVPISVNGRTLLTQAGDFWCTTEIPAGKRRQTITQVFSYLLLPMPVPAPPSELAIRREGVADKVAGAIGFSDINFESAEFSRKFYVRCRDKRFAYDVLHPRMMELLLAQTPPGVTMAGGYLCISDGRRTWSPRVFAELLPWVQQFFDLWPQHLADSHQEEQGRS
jgi:hypothetical protein